jgi:hypothetical protein
MKQSVIFIAILLLQSNAYAQNKYFEKLYKWEAIQELRNVSLFDNEMIFAGNETPEIGEWYGQIYLTNISGDTLSVKSIVNSFGYLVLVDFVKINNHFFFTGNMTQPIGGDTFQTLLLTWDRNNNQTSLKYIGDTENNSVGRAIVQSLDEKLIIVGHYDWQPYAIKIDSLGNVIWEQVYDNYPLLNWLTDIIPVPNEQAYYVYGTTNYNAFNSDILVAKISDDNGEMLWDTIYDFGSTFWDYDSKDAAGRITPTQDGGYLAGALTQGFVQLYQKGTIIKFRSNFEIIWYNDQIMYQCGPSTVNELPNGDIITSGCNDPEGESAQMQIIKLSGVDGSIKWRRSYGGSWHDYAYDLALTPDGGFFGSRQARYYYTRRSGRSCLGMGTQTQLHGFAHRAGSSLYVLPAFRCRSTVHQPKSICLSRQH